MKHILLFSTILVLVFSCSKDTAEVFLLEQPEIFYPFNNNYYTLYEYQNSVCFLWEEVEGATHYYVEVTNCNDYESFMFQETVYDDTKLCVRFDDLTCKENLKWRVQALGDNGEKSKFSNAYYKKVEKIPQIEMYCCLPVELSVLINGDLQIPAQNLDTTFVNVSEEIRFFNCGSFDDNSIHFLNEESFFQNVYLQFNYLDGAFSPTYVSIAQTDSILINGTLSTSGYNFDSFNLIFSNGASGEIVGTLE